MKSFGPGEKQICGVAFAHAPGKGAAPVTLTATTPLDSTLPAPGRLPLTVMIPVRNAEAFVEERLASVVKAGPAEIVVVDGRSPCRKRRHVRRGGDSLHRSARQRLRQDRHRHEHQPMAECHSPQGCAAQ